MNKLLVVDNVSVYYGMVRALQNICFYVEEGQTLSIVGPNGAGKSSLLNALAGTTDTKEGRITYNGQDITHQPTHKRSRSKLILVPEGRRLFTRLSVEENIKCGHFCNTDTSFQETAAHVYSLFPRLYERRHQLAGHLSGGEQQMLAIGRALASGPQLLMLDEPSMGLSPAVVRTIFTVISQIARQGVTIILVEQNVRLAIKHSERVIVLEKGNIKAAGASEDMNNNALFLNHL